MILRTRTQLMKWLEENAPTASIRRAVGEGSVEFLGWFSTLQGSIDPGWIIRIGSSITEIVWYIVVKRCRPGYSRQYHAWVLDGDPPWAFWNPPDSENPFMQGDNPEKYRQNRENITAQGRPEIHQEDNTS